MHNLHNLHSASLFLSNAPEGRSTPHGRSNKLHMPLKLCKIIVYCAALAVPNLHQNYIIMRLRPSKPAIYHHSDTAYDRQDGLLPVSILALCPIDIGNDASGPTQYYEYSE